MAKQPQKRLVVLLERCDAVAPVASVKVNPRLPRSPRVELVDCLSFPKSPDCVVKVRRKSCKEKKRKKTGKTAEAIAACDDELRCDSEDVQHVDQIEEIHETSVSKSCSAVVEMDMPPLAFEDDQPPDFAEVDGKVEASVQVCAPERLSIFDQMPLLLLENDIFFPAPEDPLLADPASLMLGSEEVLVGSGEALVEIGSRNSSLLSEYPAAELFLGLNNDVMLGDVGNRSTLLEEEELLVPGGAIVVETVAGENVEFGQNDLAIDEEIDWNFDQPWPLLEPGASLPEGHGLLNSSLDTGDSDDEFGQRMREEFLARRLRCSTRLQNQQRMSAERSLSESDNLDSDSKIVIRKRSREVPNADVQDEFVEKKSKMRRIRSKLNEKVLVPVEPTATQVEPVDGKTDTVEFPLASVSDDLDGENLKETDGQRLKKANKRDRPSTDMKAKTVQATNSLMSRNEVENSQERKNSFGKSVQSSDDGKSLRKSVDVPADEVSSAKKPSSRAKENKGAPERVTANDVKLSKSLMSSVEAAKQKYLLMKKEREANEPKELSSEEKAKKAKDGCVKNPCREPGCSASARPDSIFCSSECLSRHVEESIKLLTQDRHKTYNRSQQPGISGISDAAKAMERIVVFERKTGKLVTGPLAPTESSLLSWLQRHPTFEVLQPEQALGHVSGNLKKKKKLEHGGRRYGAESNAVSRANLSGAPSDKTQKSSAAETKLGLSGKSPAAANARSDSTSNNASHSNEKMESAEHLDPLRSNTRSELRHLLLERFDRDVSVARVKRLVIEIECELWSASRGSSSSYKQKFSGLVRIFKRPSSQDLCRRLLCAEMKPRQLLQQSRDLQRSEAAIRSDTNNSMVSPLDLLPGLIDTTDRHGDHIFDVSCRICSGRSTRTNDSERLQPLTWSDTTSNNMMSTDIDEKTLTPEVSSRLENEKGVEGDSGSSEANGMDVVLERKTSGDEFVGSREVSCEIVMSDGVVCTTDSSTVSSCVDSKRSDEGHSSVVTCNEEFTTSQHFPPSTVQSTTSVPSPEIPSGHLSADACSSGISPVILSPTVTTPGVSTGQLSIPVQKLSCKSSSRHSSLDIRPSDIPSGYSSDVSAPSVELSECPLPPSSADLIANIDQVPFVLSPTSARTSAPCSSLSTNTSSSVTVSMRHSSVEMSVETRLSSVQMQAPAAMRHASAEMLLPSRHSAGNVPPVLEGSTSATMSMSRPQGSSRANSTSSSGHDTLIDLVWKGSVSALDGATMQLCAYRTSGSMKIVRSVLPSTVTVMGRIDPKTVEDYLQKIRQQYTATREIAVICFHCHDDAEKPKYNQLFTYLQERRRCGVIGSIGSTIKDMYLWPLPARAPIPAVLLPFNGPGLDVNRFDVLLGIVIQQGRSRGCMPKQPTSTAPMHSNVVAARSNARVSVEPAPAAQDNYTPTSSEIKNNDGTSPANDESSDEVSDDDLKAIAQADPIVSKYSKARPQDLLVQARDEGDKPYDPFDEDYEIGSAAQNPLTHDAEPVLNGHQKLTELIDRGEDISPKPHVQRKTSEIHQLVDQRSCDSLAKDTAQGAEESRLRSDADSETSKHKADTVVCKQHQRSDNGSESSVDVKNTGSLDVRVHECEKAEANQDVVLIGESSKETKSPGLSTDVSSTSSKESQRKSAKASTVVSSETDEAKPSTVASCTNKKSKTKRGGVITDAIEIEVGQETTLQSTEVSHPDASSPETLTSIATILTQLSEKNALNQDILRSLLDQLLSVYGAQNDRDQRAILVKLVETIEKQHSVTEKQESMTESQQSVTERQQSMTEQQQTVAKNEKGVAETQQSLMEGQQSVTKKQQSVTVDQQSMTERQQNVAKMQTGKSVAAEAVPDGGAQTKAHVEKHKSEVLETCHQPTGIESQVEDDESKRMGDQFNIRFLREPGLDSRREVAQSRLYDERSDTYQVTPEEWHVDFGKPLVKPGERGPWNFQKHFPAEHGRTEDSAESSPAKDVIQVPALGGKGVESRKDDLLGKAALGLVGPKANQGQNVSPRFGLVCPEFNQGQNGMTIARSEANVGREEVVTKSMLMEESCVSSWSRHVQKSGSMSAGEETYDKKDSVAENDSIFRKGDKSSAESDYPAIYQTDIQSRLVKDKPTQQARYDGYNTGWFSPPHEREPVHGVWNSEKRPQGLDPESRVLVEGSPLHSTALPRQTGELRSCLKKRKPETRIEEPGINMEKILPVLSDSSFEALKSIVMSAKSAGIVPPRDPLMERRSQEHTEDQHRPMTAENSLDVLTNASFWSSPSFSQPLASPPFLGRHSPERPLLSPTFSNAGRLPAPPKPPPSLLQGTRIRASVPEAFGDSQLPKTWMRTCPPHPGFQSPTIYEQVNPCRKISPSGGIARLTFSPPWGCGDPAYPAGQSRWLGSVLQERGCLPGRSSPETAMEDWSYPYENPRVRSLAIEAQQFLQSNNYDTANVLRAQNRNSLEQCMADERAKGMAIARDDVSGKEMIERNFGHCHNKRSRFPDIETAPLRPSFLSDQDYRKPFCDSGTKSLFDSTYNDREFPENSYEFFGSIPKDGSNFESLGELLPGLGALETTDFSERTVDLFGDPSSQTDGDERIAGFDYDQSHESSRKAETTVKTEIDQMLAPGSAKTDTPAKTEPANKSEIATTFGSDLKADHSELNIGDDVSVKTEPVAYTSTEMTSRTESSAESEITTKTSPSRFDFKTASVSNKDADRETDHDQALSETSGKTDGIDKDTASELQIRNADKEDELSEALASFSALIEHCTKTEFDTSDTTPDEAQLINDVSKLVKRCLDSDLLSYSEICGRLGLSSLVFDEKGSLVDDEPLPHVEKSCSESLGVNGELRSHLSSKRRDSQKIQQDVSMENMNRSKSERNTSNSAGLQRDGLHSTQDLKPNELDSDSDTATHINESGDCIIGHIDKSSGDSKMQWDVTCSGDPLQTVVDGQCNAMTESLTDRVMDGSRVRLKACKEPRVSVKHHSRASDEKSRLRTDSCDSGDSLTNQRCRDSRSSSNRQTRDSYSSCDSPEKRRHRHDSRDSSEKRRCYQSSDSKQSHRHDSSESSNYPGHRDSTAKRKRGHDSSGRASKHSRHSHDTEEDCEELLFISDEPEKRDRTRDQGTKIKSRGGSYQSSDSDNQRFRKNAATSLVSVDDDKHFIGRRSATDTRPGMRNDRSHRGRRRDGIRHDRTRSPSESSDRTATSGERRRDCLERSSGNRSAHDDERTFRKFWKEEEHLNDEVGKRSQRRQNDDREERIRRTYRTHDPRSEKRHKEDAFGSKQDDAKMVGLAAFAGFISRRIPLEVETEMPWSKDHARFVDTLHSAIKNKNLITDMGSDKSRAIGESMGVDWKIRPSTSQDCGSGKRRLHYEQSDYVGNLVADAIAKSLPVSSTSVRERQKSLCSRDGKSSELKQSVCTERMHANGGDGTSNDQETADRSTGHQQEPGGQLLPNGQQTQMVPTPRNASNGQPAANLDRQQKNNGSPLLSGLRKTRPSPKKQPVKVATDEELEEGEIVDAPDEWPSATRDLLALLNAPKSWVSPVPAITRFARHQPGPSKT